MKPYADQTVSTYDDMVRLFKYVKQFLNGELLHITVKPWNPKRSDVQNKLMWVYNTRICLWMNENTDVTATPEDWHEYLVETKWGMRFNAVTQKQTRYETKKFSIKKMVEHLEWLERFAAERGIPLEETVERKFAMTGKTD